MSQSPENEAHAKRQMLEAEAALRTFIETLPAQYRWQIEDKSPKSKNDVGLDGDIAESPAASYLFDPSDGVDDIADELAEQFQINHAMASGVALFLEEYLIANSEKYNDWLIAKVIIRLTSAENCKIAAVAMAFALGVPRVWVNGELHDSQLSASEALGCTRSNLCKAVRFSAEFLGIEEGIHLKRPEAVKAFRDAGNRNHWRKRRYLGMKHGK